MSRVIKFRAWYDGKMRYAKDGTNFFDSEGAFPDTIIEVLSSWKWMQFTGLLDCTGREIYEGDIVKSALDYVHFFPTEVTWDAEGGYTFFADGEHGHGGREVEVIGNIHENPELLTNRILPCAE